MTSDSPLHDYYESRFVESERLGRREGQLELERTRELLARYLPPAPARIIDIGGGTGVHASWLAELGHDVHLIDVVPSHVETAAASGTFTAAVEDARSLDEDDDSYDVALVLGPLYHLLDAGDRLRALDEARRVVRPGGMVVTAYISRLAVALDGYVKGWIHNERGSTPLRNIVETGFDAGGGFGAIAYFHLPSEIAPELEAAGLAVEAILGIEGPGWIAADFDDRWNKPDHRPTVLESARACESSPELLGLSGHILAVARKP